MNPRLIIIALLGLLLTHPALARADEVLRLINGDTLRGVIIETTDTTVRLQHPLLGEITVPRSSIAPVKKKAPGAPIGNVPPTLDSAVAESAAAPADRRKIPNAAEPAAPAEEPKPPPPADWSARVELGLTGSYGNTEDTSLRVALNASRITPGSVTRFDSSYFLATRRGDRSANKAQAGILQEWPLPRYRWNMFGQGRYEYDEFNTWDQRVSAGGGVGYRLFLVETPDEDGSMEELFRLDLRAGLGAVREFGSDRDETVPELILGLNSFLQLSPRQTIAAASTWFPSLDGSDEFRVVSALDWIWTVDQLDGISLKIGVNHEYQSEVDMTSRNNDLAVYGALVIDF